MKCIGLEKVSVVLIILALGLGNVRAEEHEDTIYYEAEEGYTDIQGMPPGYDKGKKVGWRGADAPPGLAKKAELEKLKKLRENNPEKFKEIVQKRKANQSRRLQHLKKTNPEKYKKVLKKHHYLKGNPPGLKGGPGAGSKYKKGKDHKRDHKGGKVGRNKPSGKRHGGKRGGSRRK